MKVQLRKCWEKRLLSPLDTQQYTEEKYYLKITRRALCALVLIPTLSLAAPVISDDVAEPIAYVGHGSFLNSQGEIITPSYEFIANAQEWYLDTLTTKLDPDRRYEFALHKERLSGLKVEGQTALIVQQSILNWLTNNVEELDARAIGKIKALGNRLQWQLPKTDSIEALRELQAFTLDPEIKKELDVFNLENVSIELKTATTNAGQAYIDECTLAGVPIPPQIGSSQWQSRGFIPPSELFLASAAAEVLTYESSSPEGVCIALPRYTNTSLTTVGLDGIICQGKVSSKVCIWDNQMSGVSFPFTSGSQIPIGLPDLAVDPAGRFMSGGAELTSPGAGICSDCHAGENPYIIHPDAMLTGSLAFGDLDLAPLNLPMFANNRYDPIVLASWPQNQLSMSPPFVPAVCSGCHQQGVDGRFPHLSDELPGYCGTVLAQAITDTMPPYNPGGEANNPDVIAFQNWCNVDPTTGPSNRGDPHLTTTNGITYDFQAAGEFTSLKNSATGFELQTRQSPVQTTFTPGPNAYTGLASCVSLNTAAAVRLGKYRVSYQPEKERMVLRINGEEFVLPKKGFDLGDGNMLIPSSTGDGIEAIAADGTRVIITPNYWASQGYHYLNVEVLNTPAREGTMGHISSGQWLPHAPDGSLFGAKPAALIDRHILLNIKFADNWRVTASTSLFDYAPGTSTADFTNKSWPPKPGEACEIPGVYQPPIKPIDEERASALCREVEDKVAFESCVFDTMVMGEETVAEAYLKTIQVRGGL